MVITSRKDVLKYSAMASGELCVMMLLEGRKQGLCVAS